MPVQIETNLLPAQIEKHETMQMARPERAAACERKKETESPKASVQQTRSAAN
jgi:hypothetical protein